MTLDGAKDAYELSLVAVPAQPRAGVSKHYGGESVKETVIPDPVDVPNEEHTDSNIKDAELRLRATESFLFAHTNKSEEE
jgi:hypothetical protein